MADGYNSHATGSLATIESLYPSGSASLPDEIGSGRTPFLLENLLEGRTLMGLCLGRLMDDSLGVLRPPGYPRRRRRPSDLEGETRWQTAAIHQCPLGAVACCSRFLLTCGSSGDVTAF